MPAGYVSKVAEQQSVGTFFATYTTAKTVINPSALWTVPAGYFCRIGQQFEVDVWGAISNIVTTPGTITMQCMIGTIVAFTTGAMQMSTTAHTKLPFHLKVLLTLEAIGSGTTAKFRGMAEIASQTVSVSGADATTGHAILQAPNTTPAQGTGWDSTIANIFDFWVGFSISNAANGVEIHQYRVMDLG